MGSQTLVVGDIQGCYSGLKKLLEKARFKPGRDKLYAVGDLVARGDDSLSTLEYLRDLGDAFHAVLGNHDLHLLAVSQGIRQAKSNDNLSQLLNSPQFDSLIDWLRQFPLACRLNDTHTMVHAGLYPGWSISQLLAMSDELSARLRADDFNAMLETMYGNTPSHWDEQLDTVSRQRFIVNACTRMRFIGPDKSLEFATKSNPAQAPADLAPWFAVSNPSLKKEEKIVFGHWAALEGNTQDNQFIALDTGYVWGQTMTALRLEDNRLIQVAA
ncbi:symmetrical bis(5'-nucleosyl)-tetraphosphatase [Alteromonas halophila]|uniref:bis(5'-nucleosyl)-tetraphosphatase (symmetrical) n=1 Tax=Alteromonas halophila TaxID=516698 RepID=A0A918MX93_9ALTE|nr:symmetrical bis(5'-nucleosyl)-tetraphosphatase [Alteromonas halophila]GGW80762.1 bis(5'-nucleosyl)-tetraphosphatase, symmetrical [Alteromonas halophila]